MLIRYTPRYISKYWLIVIHNELLNMELKYLHGIQDKMILSNETLNNGKLIKLTDNSIYAKNTLLLLKSINSKIKIENGPPLLILNKLYLYRINNKLLFVPIKKNEFYNEMKWGYQSYFNEDISEWAIVIGLKNNDKFNNLGIYKFPKSARFLNDNISGIKYSSKLVSQPDLTGQEDKGNSKNITPKQFRQFATRNTCWYSKERQKVHGISNLDFDELHCINNGGVWDKPCTKSEDCPFADGDRNVCMPSGICDIPYGIERIGYSYYNKRSIPNCVRCNNLDFDKCCDGDKYKFKWTKK